MRQFVVIWLLVVITVLGVFGLVKVGAYMFPDIRAGSLGNARQEFTKSCEHNEWGDESGVPNTQGAHWTCTFPNGNSH